MDVYLLARQAIAAGLDGRTAANVRIPARRGAASVYAPEAAIVAADAFFAETFPNVLGVPLVKSVAAENDWLLFTLTDAFYDACVRVVCETLPEPPDDGGSHALNRMLALSRQAGEGCPRNANVQRALWLLLGAAYGYTSPDDAARAFRRMLDALPVGARMEARRTCGRMAAASARLYARALQR